MRKKNYRFSRIIRWMVIILFCLVLLNFGVIFYAMNALSTSSTRFVQNQLKMDVKDCETSFLNIHNLMLSEIGYDTDFDKLSVIQTNKITINVISIEKRLKNIIMNWSGDYAYKVNYMIYIPANDITINDCENTQDYDLFRKVEKEVKDYLDLGKVASGWQIREFAGEYYITDIISNNNRYIMCYIGFDDIMESLKNVTYGNNYYVTASDENEMIYYGENLLAEDEINLFAAGKQKSKPGIFDQYFILEEKIGDIADVHIVIHDFNNVLQIFRVQIIFWIMISIVIGTVVWFLTFLYTSIIRPIEDFNNNIEHLKSDEMYTVETHYQINELGNASELMKEMVSKVKGLKIDIYEKTLEQQKTKMDFLTLQIEPHFYLNCLNIIFNMAQMEDYQNIQKLSTCVSEYLRYIFRIGENMVTIKDELNHIEKYLEIQKIRYRNGFDTDIQIGKNILKAKIPPLILQTFVENVIKHAVTLEEPVSLMITGSKEGSKGEEKVVIYIEDTGEGFDKTILEKLQSGVNISESDKRIGVMNAISRLHLAFPMEADISFYNRETGGAAVKISFPYSED